MDSYANNVFIGNNIPFVSGPGPIFPPFIEPSQTVKWYTGIGSRETPKEVLIHMRKIAYEATKQGWSLRSGGALGADEAFEAGYDDYILNHLSSKQFLPNKEIYLPWQKFNGHQSLYYNVSPAAIKLAEHYHPAWNRCKQPARLLLARNGYQVLGLDLKTPTSIIICWTPDGKGEGGTGQALRIAKDYNIPVIDLGDPKYVKIFS